MAPFKKDLQPPMKGGQIHKHAGKGSKQAPMPNRVTLQDLMKPGQNTMNNYAKASPMPQPAASSLGPTPNPGAMSGLGSGNWAGNGQ